MNKNKITFVTYCYEQEKCDVVNSKEILCDEAWGDELYFTILFIFFSNKYSSFFLANYMYLRDGKIDLRCTQF